MQIDHCYQHGNPIFMPGLAIRVCVTEWKFQRGANTPHKHTQDAPWSGATVLLGLRRVVVMHRYIPLLHPQQPGRAQLCNPSQSTVTKSGNQAYY